MPRDSHLDLRLPRPSWEVHPAFRGNPTERAVREIKARCAMVEGTIHAYKAHLRTGGPAARLPGMGRSHPPRRDVPKLLLEERGWPLRVAYEDLLHHHAQMDVAWGIALEHDLRTQTNPCYSPAWVEPLDARRSAEQLKPRPLVERELGRHAGWAAFQPILTRPDPERTWGKHLEVEAELGKLETLKGELVQLAKDRMIARVRRGGPVLPMSLLNLCLGHESDRRGGRFSLEHLIEERTEEPLRSRMRALLGSVPRLDMPLPPATEPDTPSALLGMVGLSLLQGNTPELCQWTPSLLAADDTAEYHDILNRRGVLEPTAKAWQPPPRYQRPPSAHTGLLFSSTG